ncbi:MAG: ATP-binding protein [Deltaproteobacteria bacterium]|nr:ATP-binding protein [Deltaproteobacteria bacterium]MBW2020109.1 ATP-binding protein [Deltaproteobacteria bacterium]MBW2074746.1 ATP-binding protein [Deltaproteobacteria bacterium]RLB82130.1 MAG: magnesium chelatase ATPase subunit I [Deltaproteobacteria bacterium]
MEDKRLIFPFAAIVGQEKMKNALILNAINPKLGGVLIRGEKGTAKSTAVRSLAALLPEIKVVADCKVGCNPNQKQEMCQQCISRLESGEELPIKKRKTRVVELPVGSTEDRVIGTLDIEQAIKKGEKRFESGILAEANRGILYVDEINLLDDHIVDVLLDSAAMGVNIVEREGVSYSHPAEFILIGTMNPEEGELRPQLLDRFGLCVNIEGIADLDERVEVVKRWASYEEDPAGFHQLWRSEEESLRDRIVKAKEILDEVTISDEMLYLIANIAIDMNVDGHRADIMMMKASKTLAAFNGRKEVLKEDVQSAADMALQHRMRRKPFQKPGVQAEKLEGIISHAHMHKHEYVHTHTHEHLKVPKV